MRRNKVVVITGATRGIGHALAEQFIAAGHPVAGCGRSAERIASMRARYRSPNLFDVVDVSDDAAVAAWARAVIANLGPPDLLLNNAAILLPETVIWKVSASDFSSIVDINVKGVAHVCRHFLPAMIERGTGVVVNFSSGWGRSVDAGFGPYCATKWAIEGFTKALALELPASMAAIPFSPGMVDTDMLKLAFPAESREYSDPRSWAARAVPCLLRLGPRDSGKSLSLQENSIQ